MICKNVPDIFSQFSSIGQSCPTLCDPMNCSTPGFPVHHQLLELPQTHVHQVSDAIQLSHSLLVPFSSHLQPFPASESFPMNQFFTSGGQSIGATASASVFPMNIRTDFFRTNWFDLFAVQNSRESSPRPQFKSINSLAFSFLYSPTLTSIHDCWKNHSFD